MKRRLVASVMMVVLTFAFVGYNVFIREDNNSTYALSRYGSRGDEVRAIQTKLKNWGYYKGNVDGIFGSQTLEAVKYFQRKNGLTQDGIAGPKTLAAMGITSTGNQAAGASNESDVMLLARLINGEARGESYNGQVAVGAVVLNRVKNPNFPNTIAGVIYQRGAFSVVDDGQINLSPNQSCINAARDALSGFDPSRGALYYFNPAKTTNQWIWSRPLIVVIGKHRFCK